VARRYANVERAARAGLRIGERAASAVGDPRLGAALGAVRRLVGDERVPAWRRSMPRSAPGQLPSTAREGAAAVYLPACINRVFGNPRGAEAHPTLPEALVAVSARAGMPLWIPDDVVGRCCGTPWSSKGHDSGHALMAQRTAAALMRWTGGGRLAVVIDASSCTHAFRGACPDGVEVLDSIDWVHDHVLQRLAPRGRLARVVLHPTCATLHLGNVGKLTAIAAALAQDVVVPAATGCCGMAGDRGWLHPELPASALRDVDAEMDGQRFDACLSSNRTCEAALQEVTGRPYSSFVFALERLTRPGAGAA
jgi:D-lactate dehydrogenase